MDAGTSVDALISLDGFLTVDGFLVSFAYKRNIFAFRQKEKPNRN